jgi:hypothetical protein
MKFKVQRSKPKRSFNFKAPIGAAGLRFGTWVLDLHLSIERCALSLSNE